MQSFAKEFGHCRTRCTTAKNKREGQRAGTLPLAMSMFRTEGMCGTEVDLLKEVQGSEGKTAPSSNMRINIYSEGDVVALKHNYKK